MKRRQQRTYGGVRDRLEQLLADEPDIWSRHSLAAIARRLGVSRQRVKQLTQSSTKPRPRPGADALRTYVAAHPEALLPPEAGGPSTKTIARAVGVSPTRVGVLWRQLALPPRTHAGFSELQLRNGAHGAEYAAAWNVVGSAMIMPACARRQSHRSDRQLSRGCRSGCAPCRASRRGDAFACVAPRRSAPASSCP